MNTSTAIPFGRPLQQTNVARWLFLSFVVLIAGFVMAVLSPGASNAYASTCSWVGGTLYCSQSSSGGLGASLPAIRGYESQTSTYENNVQTQLRPSAPPSFDVPCGKWGGQISTTVHTGSTTMVLGQHCNMRGETFIPHINAMFPGIKPLGTLVNGYTSTCRPNGDQPPVGKKITVKVEAPQQIKEVKRSYHWINPYTKKIIPGTKSAFQTHTKSIDTSAEAKTKQLNSDSLRVIPTPGNCYYATTSSETKYCYWGMDLAYARYATNPNLSGATNISGKASVKSAMNRSEPSFTKEGGPTPCSNNLWSTASLTPDELGYYSMGISYEQRRYTAVVYTDTKFGRGGVVKAWTARNQQSNKADVYAIHACFPGGAATQGYATHAAMRAAAAAAGGYMNPAACPQPRWECQAVTNTLAGLDSSLYSTPVRSNLPTSTVLRNNQTVPVNFAQVRVVDQANGGAVDVTNGRNGPSVRNISAVDYRTMVVDGSTPVNLNAGLNATDQFFRMYSAPSSTKQEVFAGWSNKVSGGWRANANANLNKGLSFNWASDGDGQFQVQRQWRVSGEFLVPLGGAVQIGVFGTPTASPVENISAGGNRGSQWQDGTYECQDYEYRSNGTRYSTGLLTSTSNEVVVVRSANSNQP